MNNILVIDTGTSSMRGLLFGDNGEIKTMFQKQHFMNVDGDRAVQSPSDFEEGLIAICRNITEFCILRQESIDAISFTSQRSSVIPVDGDGLPLSDAMMWYDKRAQDICTQVNSKAEAQIYQICGMKATPVFSAPKIAWIKQHRRDVYEKTFKMMGIHDYLIHLCTGEFVTDTSLASRTCLLNVSKMEWSQELLSLFELEGDKLCRLIPVGSIAGYVTKEFAERTGMIQGIPVISGGGDQQCSALGQTLVEANQAGITSGTASYVVAISNQPVFDIKRRINVNVSARPNQWILEASNMSSGAVYQWLKRTFYDENATYEQVNRDVAQAAPLAGGLIMLPDLAGKGCPQWDSYARGSFVNIGFQHDRKDFARAAIEGIAAEITECYEVLKECLGSFSKITSTGGLSKMTEFNQILADMMNSQVYRSTIGETTGIGAWANAMVATGVCDSVKEVFEKMKKEEQEPVSVPNSELYRAYQKQSEVRRYLRQSIDNQKLHEMLE